MSSYFVARTEKREIEPKGRQTRQGNPQNTQVYETRFNERGGGVTERDDSWLLKERNISPTSILVKVCKGLEKILGDVRTQRKQLEFLPPAASSSGSHSCCYRGCFFFSPFTFFSTFLPLLTPRISEGRHV